MFVDRITQHTTDEEPDAPSGIDEASRLDIIISGRIQLRTSEKAILSKGCVCVCDDAVEWHILHYYFDQRINRTGRQDLFIVNTHLSLQYFGTQFEVLERVASRASNVVRPDKKRHLCAPWAVSGSTFVLYPKWNSPKGRPTSV